MCRVTSDMSIGSSIQRGDRLLYIVGILWVTNQIPPKAPVLQCKD